MILSRPAVRLLSFALACGPGAPDASFGGDCRGVACSSCATVEPTFQPINGDIVVYYDPNRTDRDRARCVAENASGASLLAFPPWDLGPACTIEPHCRPKYRIVIKDIAGEGQVPPSAPHLIFLDMNFIAQATPLEVAEVVYHQWVHWVQLCHYDIEEYEAWGEWIIEGTAACLEDKIESQVDENPDSFYVRDWAGGYLGAPGESLYYQDYKAALWWTYISEQLGTGFDEPALGVDVIRHFMAYALPQNPPDSMKYLRRTIEDFDPTRSLVTLFRDFSIANYTKRLNLDALPEACRDRYRCASPFATPDTRAPCSPSRRGSPGSARSTPTAMASSIAGRSRSGSTPRIPATRSAKRTTTASRTGTSSSMAPTPSTRTATSGASRTAPRSLSVATRSGSATINCRG